MAASNPNLAPRLVVNAGELGAEFIFELNDQPYGRRDCRMRDPFGHLWILGHEL